MDANADSNQTQADMDSGTQSTVTQSPAGEQPVGIPPSAAHQPPAAGETTLDAFMASLSDEQRSLFEQHTHGLKSALDAERGARKRLERQIKDAAAKADEGSALRGQLDELSSTLSATNARLVFYEAAPDHAVRPKAVRLAYLAARDGTFLKDEGIDWEGLQSAYPDLFESAQAQTMAQRVSTNGAAGTRTDIPVSFDMNRLIRQTR